MTTNRNAAPHSSFGVAAGELFNVVLVYDDLASAHRGLALYQRLVNELGSDDDFHLTVWKFTVLGVARLAELSTEQAVTANLVIVCTRDAAAPPEQVQAWFQCWLELKGHTDCALVVLDGADHDQPEPARQGGFFHDLARCGRVAVFPSAVTATPCAAHGDGRTRFASLANRLRRTGEGGLLNDHRQRAPFEAQPPESFNPHSP